MRRLAVALAMLSTVAITACGPLAEEEAFIDEPSSGAGSGAEVESTEAAISFDESLKEQFPPELNLILDRASEIAGIVSQVKAGIGVVKILTDIFGLTGGSPGLSPEFAALHAELNRVGSVLSEQNRQILRDELESVFEVSLREAQRAVGERRPLAAGVDFASQVALTKATKPSVFERYHVPRSRKQHWERTVASPVPREGMVYDWRGAFPTLLLYSTLRTAIMAAAEPDFHQTTTFDLELQDMQRHIGEHMRRIFEGVKCGERTLPNLNPLPLLPLAPRGLPLSLVGVAHFHSGRALPASETIKVVTCVDVHTGAASEHVVHGRTADPAFHAKVADMKGEVYQDIIDTLPIEEMDEISQRLQALEQGR